MGATNNSGLYSGTKGAARTSQTTGKLPLTSKPNSKTQKIDGTGSIISERYFDSEGKAKYDIDYANHGNPKRHPKVPHTHDWTRDGAYARRGDAK